MSVGRGGATGKAAPAFSGLPGGVWRAQVWAAAPFSVYARILRNHIKTRKVVSGLSQVLLRTSGFRNKFFLVKQPGERAIREALVG